MHRVDILIPTCNRPEALAATLTSLIGQRFTDFRVHVMDQSDGAPAYDHPVAVAALRVLRSQGRGVEVARNLPRRGMAQQRQALLERATAPQVLFLDDDVILEPGTLQRMVEALEVTGCGFIGSAVIGLSYAGDVRPHQQYIEWWHDNVVEPENVLPGSSSWQRHKRHNAANIWHVQRALGLEEGKWRLYKLAWVGGCVLFDRDKLLQCGGFTFWKEAPAEHCGEDVYAQLQVMRRFGGAGIIPSGAFHQELPTTLEQRDIDLPHWFNQPSSTMASTGVGSEKG